jgi:mannosyltransferase OCH1-like enzyme
MTTIPANIFQTWKTKNLPSSMKACVSRLKRQNPEFKYFLYDDEDCREFIAEHFDTDVLESFDILLPGAYKADLWRYCVLYMRGGIYLDIKYECVKEFKLESLLDKPHYVIDRKEFAEPGKNIVYNGFIVSPAKNPILKKCIDQIVINVQNREYGFNPLYPTGPGLFGEVLGRDKDIDLEYSPDAKNILWNGKKILQMYPEYREEQETLQPGKHYDNLWKQGLIYQP